MGNAKHAMGTTLKKGVNTVAELTEIGGVDMSADTIDVTTLSSSNNFREFIQGLKDGGEVSMSGFFYPGDTNGQAALLTAFENGTSDTYTITFPAAMGATWTFDAIVTTFTTGAAMEDAVSFECTVKVTGKPSLGVTASGGLTALSLTGSIPTFSPAFANGIYSYSHTFATSTSITVTATAASHTLKLYIDGVFIENLVSGSASSAIAFAAGQSKLIEIVAYESGKTPKTYTVVAVRTS